MASHVEKWYSSTPKKLLGSLLHHFLQKKTILILVVFWCTTRTFLHMITFFSIKLSSKIMVFRHIMTIYLSSPHFDFHIKNLKTIHNYLLKLYGNHQLRIFIVVSTSIEINPAFRKNFKSTLYLEHLSVLVIIFV